MDFNFFFINTNIVEQYYNRYPSYISLISVEKYFLPCSMKKLLDRCLALTELLSQVVFNTFIIKKKLQVKVQATLFQPFIRVLIFFLIHLHLFFNIKFVNEVVGTCSPHCTVISADTSSIQPK